VAEDDPDLPASAPCFVGEFASEGPDPADLGAVALWRRGERRRLLAARAALPVASRAPIEAALAAHLDSMLEERFGDPAGRVISAYWPIKGEPDLRGWMAGLHARGARVALPVVETPGTPLVFRVWEPGLRMVRGHWNIPVPPPDAARVVPEIALAPLVGWDGEAYRLGYGGGYFDRTLAALDPRPFVIGVGLQGARLVSIHPQPHDVGLDAIVTEAGLQAEGKGGRAGL
jgi:5,10-methenyltetrahydrofolate synthetase